VVYLATNDAEVSLLSRSGLECMMGNHNIFTEENVWKPQATSEPMLGAIYNAALASYKRHELASSIDSLMLLYRPGKETQENLARLRKRLPRAIFANHDLNGGRYRRFSPAEVCTLLSRGRVGLCLSHTEGAMRASIEYLLCGLPVVSTQSVGGRDRYFAGNYCTVTGDDPDEIAQAVRQAASRSFDRMKIRSHVGELLGFDRYQFLSNANRFVLRHTGVSAVFRTIRPFYGSLACETLSKIASRFQEQNKVIY